jgi:chromosome segregation ATPase
VLCSFIDLVYRLWFSHARQVDTELSLKSEETRALSRELDQKRTESSRLGNAKNAVQSRQKEYDQAKADFDSFSETYKIRSDGLKRELSVRIVLCCCCFLV